MRPSLSHKLAISSLLLLLCQAGLYGQQGGGLSRTATSTITTRNDKQRGVIVHITNRRFTFTNYYPDRLGKDEPFPTILLLEEFTSERSLSEEGQQGSVKVEAWVGKDADASRKLWTIEHEGDEGEIADRFYRVVKHGCCDAEDTRIYFNLTTGQKVFTSTADIFQVEVPNTSSQFLRYVAFHSGFASLPTAETENQKNVVGILQYASVSKVINRVLIRARTEAAAELRAQAIKARYQQKVSDTSPLTLWGVDGKAAASSLSSFSIVLTFYDNVQVEIPVANDQLDISRAIVPKGLVLQMAK